MISEVDLVCFHELEGLLKLGLGRREDDFRAEGEFVEDFVERDYYWFLWDVFYWHLLSSYGFYCELRVDRFVELRRALDYTHPEYYWLELAVHSRTNQQWPPAFRSALEDFVKGVLALRFSLVLSFGFLLFLDDFWLVEVILCILVLIILVFWVGLILSV